MSERRCCISWRGVLIGVLLIVAGLCWLSTVHGVEIIGPPGNELLVDPIEPGRYVRLGINDVDKSLLTEKGLIWYPQAGVDLIPAMSWESQEPFLLFRADREGFHQIGLFVVLDGKLDRSVVVIQVGEIEPVPPPDPDPPPPDPDPPPPPVVEPVVIIIEETSERTPEQFRAMAAPAWREWVLSRGGMVRIVDKDIKAEPLDGEDEGKTPEDLVEWIKGAKGLPYMFFACGKGIVRWEGAFPEGDGALLKIFKEHGGE